MNEVYWKIKRGGGMFICDRCGLCCMQVGVSPAYSELDRGDGICMYFDCVTKLCTIYDQRPLLCNIEKAYQEYFKDTMSKNDYYRLNYEACDKLKRGSRRGCF